MTDSQSGDLFGYSERDAYPYVPAARATDTSREAAEYIAPQLGRIQSLVFAAIARSAGNGLSPHELALELGEERTTVQPRTSELRRLGKIVDSGKRRHNPNGKRAIVWTLPRYAAALSGGD